MAENITDSDIEKVIVDNECGKRTNASRVWKHFGFSKINGVINRNETVCKICNAVKP